MTVIEPISVADTAARLTEALIQCYHTTISDRDAVSFHMVFFQTHTYSQCVFLFQQKVQSIICIDAICTMHASCEISCPTDLCQTDHICPKVKSRQILSTHQMTLM